MKNSVWLRYLLVAIFAASLLGVFLVRFAAGAIPDSSMPEPVTFQSISPMDGPSILEQHCAQCHNVQRLEQTMKSPEEWNGIVSRMEGLGVQLSETEKTVLIDYLAIADEP